MIIMIGGAPCSGKSTLTRSILSELGESEMIEPMKLFPCQRYNDILVVGRYPQGETFGGTDRISYGAIKQFRNFIQSQQPNYKHILIEGDRFFRSSGNSLTADLEWLVNNYDARIYILEVSLKTERQRHMNRGDDQSEKWLKTRRSLISNLKSNFLLMDSLNIRNTERNDVKSEILLDIGIQT